MTTVAPASGVAPGLARCRAAEDQCGDDEGRDGSERPPQQPEQQGAHPQLLGDGRLQRQAEPGPRRGGTDQGDVVGTGGDQDAHQRCHHHKAEGCAGGEAGQRRPECELGGAASLAEPHREGVAAESGSGSDQQPNKLQRLVSRREPINCRLCRKAERHPGQEEQQHQPAERP